MLINRCTVEPSSILFAATFDLKPIPKGRPRFANGHAYTPQRTRDYEEKLRWLMRANGAQLTGERVGALVEFATPDKRADSDNLLKMLFDASNSVLVIGDQQIREVCCRMLDNEKKAFTRFTLYRL